MAGDDGRRFELYFANTDQYKEELGSDHSTERIIDVEGGTPTETLMTPAPRGNTIAETISDVVQGYSTGGEHQPLPIEPTMYPYHNRACEWGPDPATMWAQQQPSAAFTPHRNQGSGVLSGSLATLLPELGKNKTNVYDDALSMANPMANTPLVEISTVPPNSAPNRRKRKIGEVTTSLMEQRHKELQDEQLSQAQHRSRVEFELEKQQSAQSEKKSITIRIEGLNEALDAQTAKLVEAGKKRDEALFALIAQGQARSAQLVVECAQEVEAHASAGLDAALHERGLQLKHRYEIGRIARARKQAKQQQSPAGAGSTD